MYRKTSDFSLFILACLLALLLLTLGLRCYFSQSRLEEKLAYTISSESFIALEGSINFDKQNKVLQVYSDDNKNSTISVSFPELKSDWFKRIDVNFAYKPSQQMLTIALLTRNVKTNKLGIVEEKILYTDNSTSKLSNNIFANEDEVITGLQLLTDNLISTYNLKEIHFVLKKFDNADFLELLWNDLVSNQKTVLISAKQFLVIYFSLVAVIFTFLLLRLQRTLIKVWWWILIVAWLLLDARYIYQKSQGIWQLTTSSATVNTPNNTLTERK